jgi:hypothetical protein
MIFTAIFAYSILLLIIALLVVRIENRKVEINHKTLIIFGILKLPAVLSLNILFILAAFLNLFSFGFHFEAFIASIFYICIIIITIILQSIKKYSAKREIKIVTLVLLLNPLVSLIMMWLIGIIKDN